MRASSHTRRSLSRRARTGSALLRELVDQLEPFGDVVPAVLQAAKQIASQLDTVLVRQDLMLEANEKLLELALAGKQEALAGKQEALAANEKVLAANEKVLELALAGRQEALAGRQEALADKHEALAGKHEALAGKQETMDAKDRASSMLIMMKTAELASFKAQFEPRIMIDIIYDAIMSSNAFTDDLKKGKWGILLDGVLTTDDKNNSILTPAAMRDLADLDATKELATVVCDLKSISNRLASAHHKGASDLSGMGWRLGVQLSPSLAAALIVIKNLRMLDERQIYLPLKEPVAFLNLRADVSHELNFDRLCWGAKLLPQGKGGA
jgi:hypothetical protein